MRLIDADALLARMKKAMESGSNLNGTFHLHIEHAPTITRPTGEWIFNPTDAIDLMFAKPKCSKCGFESSDGGNFCHNCGARMLGEDGEA